MKYVTLPDIRHTASWKNPNAARLYMYMVMSQDPATHGYRYSRRWTCKEIGITEDAFRHALTLLEKDGLIRKSTPQTTPRNHPREHPTPPPHITVVSVSELYSSNPPSSTPSYPPSSTPSSTHNIIKHKENNLSHPRVREVLKGSVKDIQQYCHCSEDQAQNALRAFAQAMNAKQKVWESPEDAKQHLLDWSLKHYFREKSVLTAERSESERLERDRLAHQQPSPEQEQQEKRKYILEHLQACPRLDVSRKYITNIHRSGAFYDDVLRQEVEELFAKAPALRQQIADALGFDVLSQGALHL